MSRQHVRDMWCTAALAWTSMMRAILQRLDADFDWVELFFERLKFDDAEQRIAPFCHPDLSIQQRVAKWHILISVRSFGIRKGLQRLEVPVPTPPSILFGTKTAGCVYDALFMQHCTACLLGFYKGWLPKRTTPCLSGKWILIRKESKLLPLSRRNMDLHIQTSIPSACCTRTASSSGAMSCHTLQPTPSQVWGPMRIYWAQETSGCVLCWPLTVQCVLFIIGIEFRVSLCVCRSLKSLPAFK